MNHQLSYHKSAIHTFHGKSQRCFHHGLVFITLFLWFSSRKNQFHWDLPPPSCKSAEWRQATPLGAMQIQVSSYRDATFTTGLFWGRKTMDFSHRLPFQISQIGMGWDGKNIHVWNCLSMKEGLNRIAKKRRENSHRFVTPFHQKWCDFTRLPRSTLKGIGLTTSAKKKRYGWNPSMEPGGWYVCEIFVSHVWHHRMQQKNR